MAKIELLNMDCMEYMAGLPDKAFDLAIVDPPYGINFAAEKERKSGQFKFKCKDWDNKIPEPEYFKELFRVSVNQIIWGGNYFLDYLPKTSCVIIWDKINPEGMRFSDGEMAWGSFKSSLRICKIVRTYRIEEQMHPTQKPVELYRWLLQKYTEPGDRILDTHGGSMSIALACYDLNFDLTLCEIDKEYFNTGKERFDNHAKQGQVSKIFGI